MFLEYDREYKVKLARLKFKSIVYLSCEKCLKKQEGEIKNIYEICMNIFTVTKTSTLNMAAFLDLSLHCDEFVLQNGKSSGLEPAKKDKQVGKHALRMVF